LRNRVVELHEVLGQLEGDAAVHETPQLSRYSLGFLLSDSAGAHEDLHRRIEGSELIIYPDSGHGGIFEFHDKFAPVVVEFLGR
jgi:pimeloyl-ACP methyl ester carboxylesterase